MRKVTKSLFGKVKTIKVEDSGINPHRIYAFIDESHRVFYLHRDSTPPEACKPYSFKCLDNCHSYKWERFDSIKKALRYMARKFDVYEFKTQDEFLRWAIKNTDSKNQSL